MLGETSPATVESMRGGDYNDTGAGGDCEAYAGLHPVT